MGDVEVYKISYFCFPSLSGEADLDKLHRLTVINGEQNIDVSKITKQGCLLQQNAFAKTSLSCLNYTPD